MSGVFVFRSAADYKVGFGPHIVAAAVTHLEMIMYRRAHTDGQFHFDRSDALT